MPALGERLWARLRGDVDGGDVEPLMLAVAIDTARHMPGTVEE